MSIKSLYVDIRRRINFDTLDLEKDIRHRGMTVPIDVEGSENDGFYYLINGDRRLEAWKNAKLTDIMTEACIQG